MVYFGTSLRIDGRDNDPCLIDPTKEVAGFGSYRERQMDYWPSYSTITSTARRAYLDWVIGGRKDPIADVGYVFLFFYGLERRVLVDAPQDAAARAELPAIAQELRRLLAIYGEQSRSFQRYATGLLEWIALRNPPPKLYSQRVPDFSRMPELPMYVRLALGQAAVDAVPVPGELALAWARLEPSVNLRTPAQRFPELFAKAFLSTYRERHGEGIELRRNKTKLKFVYQPASSAFRFAGEISRTFDGVPDVSVLTGPQKQLQQLAAEVTEELDTYSRFVGRNPEAKDSLEATLLLPPSMWPDAPRKGLASLKSRVGSDAALLKGQELLELLGGAASINKEKARALGRALESEGLGIEPDLLHGAKAPKSEDTVVVFALGNGEKSSEPVPSYQAAMLTVQLASAVAHADGEFSEREVDHLQDQIRAWTHLTSAHIRRLLAHLRLLVMQPVSLASLKKKLEPLPVAAKETIATFMATVAQSDGVMTADEVKILEKVYKTLGIDPKKVFTDVHAVATGSKPLSTAAATAGGGFQLDRERIAALQKDTERVSALLSTIFTEDQETTPPVSMEPQDTEPTVSTGLLGLDEAHSSLVRMLLSRPEWARQDLEDIAEDLELMLDGALEAINEAALDAFDAPLIEGENPLSINAEVVEKIEA